MFTKASGCWKKNLGEVEQGKSSCEATQSATHSSVMTGPYEGLGIGRCVDQKKQNTHDVRVVILKLFVQLVHSVDIRW